MDTDMNEYFRYVYKKLNEMTDEEFIKLLEDSGLEKCPCENIVEECD